MQTADEQDHATKKFELAGSTAHYVPSLDFTITFLALDIKPDFSSKSITCSQMIEIASLQPDLKMIILDAAELNVDSILADGSAVTFRALDDKLTIFLDKPLERSEEMKLTINYAARPRKGFYFVSADKEYPDKRTEAWTQGETMESKYWFPCLDHPVVKFPSRLRIHVPPGYIAISNGKLVGVEHEKDGTGTRFDWIEQNPHPAYLTSVVIGKYAEIREGELLYYYVPQEKKDDAPRSFDRTPEMIQFFEQYFGIKYPFEKYAQVAVQDFVYGGMENSSCTTLTLDTLHDSKAHVDFTSEHLVSHELAHQWFGDLVTCRDWQHIWLNEGFATYCEALYWESSRGKDEFLYYVMQTADDYLEEAAGRYTRPIVTNRYKHPDDLFDRHTYEKAGMVLHMLRHIIGDQEFRRSVKTYLERFANSTAETNDLRRIAELETGKSLQQFFDQWLYRAGHPQLKIEFSLDADSAKVKIEQTQSGEPFEFPLEVDLASVAHNESHGNPEAKVRMKKFTLDVTEKKMTFQLPLQKAESVEWFSIDPEIKLLKSISVKAPKELLISQLLSANTVVEKIEAARSLAGESAESVVDALLESIKAEGFWGVGAEAAKSLGTIKTDYAFEALKKCLRSAKHAKVRRAVVKAMGEFRRSETLDALISILENGDESYFVESEAATSIGKSRDRRAIPVLKKALDTFSFQNIIAQGAVNGLKEFSDDKDIAQLLIEKSKYGNYHRVREAATFALGNYLQENKQAFEHLRDLLYDKWFRVRINACRAFAQADSVKAIPDLQGVAERDPDHRVRRVAEECSIIIRQASTKPKEIESMREEFDKIKSKNLELLQKMDRLERQSR